MHFALVTQQKSTNEHEQHYLYKVAFTYSHPPFLRQYLKVTFELFIIIIIIVYLFTLIYRGVVPGGAHWLALVLDPPL